MQQPLPMVIKSGLRESKETWLPIKHFPSMQTPPALIRYNLNRDGINEDSWIIRNTFLKKRRKDTRGEAISFIIINAKNARDQTTEIQYNRYSS